MRVGYDPKLGRIKTDAKSVVLDRSFLAHLQISAALATVAAPAGIHAANATSSTLVTTVTTAITNPSVPRNITATAGGTAASIAAVQVTVNGTNYADEVITEDLPAFTVDTAGLVAGSKAFKTVTSIVIPIMDGAGATMAVGFGEKLGLPCKLAHNTVLKTSFDNTIEATAPTVTVSETVLESNMIDLNSALNSKVVDVYLMV